MACSDFSRIASMHVLMGLTFKHALGRLLELTKPKAHRLQSITKLKLPKLADIQLFSAFNTEHKDVICFKTVINKALSVALSYIGNSSVKTIFLLFYHPVTLPMASCEEKAEVD